MRKKFVFVTVSLLAAVLLSGCGGPVRGATWPGMTADDNTAYLADGSLVYAVNLKDGRELWHYPENANSKLVFYSTPVITPDGLVIVGSSGNDHRLIAINPNDINPETNSPVEAWTFTEAEDHWVAAPLIIGNRLFAPNTDGNLYVLRLDDDQSAKVPVKVVELNGRLWAQPVTDGKRVFVTSLDHSVYAVDVETYEILWHKDLTGAVPGAPVLGPDGMLYVGSFASQLERFDPATGEHKSMLDTDGEVWGTPSILGNTLYFGDLNGKFYSFNINDEKINWSPIQSDGPITANPLVLDESILVVTESGSVYEVDQEGRSILWSQPPGGKIYTAPVAAGDLILIAPLETDAYLYAYGKDGRLAWKFPAEK